MPASCGHFFAQKKAGIENWCAFAAEQQAKKKPV